MKKIKLFVDFDNTMVNSNKAVVNILNKRYGVNKDYRDCYKYSYKDLFPQLKEKEVLDIYESDEFYSQLEFVEDSYEILSFVRNSFDICVVSLGTELNLIKKREFILEKNSDLEIKKVHTNTNNNLDKNFIDMSESILIDDNSECLRNSNAKIKILFRNNKDTEWNKVYPNEEFYIVNSWEEISDILEFYERVGKII